MPSRRRVLNEAELAEWAEFARRIRLLPGRVLPEPPLPPFASSLPGIGAPRAGSDRTPSAAPSGPAATSLAVGSAPPGLDRASWHRLRSGKLAPERTLDLHGRTAQAAFVALHGFLRRAQADQVRCVEVITGRGTGERGGVLRRELPLWLNQPALRPLVLAATHPHAGNSGAVRLLLRRAR